MKGITQMTVRRLLPEDFEFVLLAGMRGGRLQGVSSYVFGC